MNKTTKNNSYIRFLKDEKFIKWKLFPTDELDIYWSDFLRNNPQELDDFALAEEYFKKIKFDSSTLFEEQRIIGLRYLENSLYKYRKKKKRRVLYTSIAAACITFALLVGTLLFNQSNSSNIAEERVEYIVGNELSSQDIKLISENETTSFNENVDIEVGSSGKVEVTRTNEQKDEIVVDEKALTKLVVPYGKRSSITLSDGTQIWLNSGSVLEFPSVFNNKSRDIYLITGEVYMDVATDNSKPFYLHTPEFDVKVYGTSFNVSIYDNSPKSVVLVEGSLGLLQEDKELLLKPNERAFYTQKEPFSKEKVEATLFTSWKDGYYVFNDTPISEVLNLIGRYYNISFSFENETNLNSSTCSGKLDLSNNLDELMRAIALLSGTNFYRKGDLIYISRE